MSATVDPQTLERADITTDACARLGGRETPATPTALASSHDKHMPLTSILMRRLVLLPCPPRPAFPEFNKSRVKTRLAIPSKGRMAEDTLNLLAVSPPRPRIPLWFCSPGRRPTAQGFPSAEARRSSALAALSGSGGGGLLRLRPRGGQPASHARQGEAPLLADPPRISRSPPSPAPAGVRLPRRRSAQECQMKVNKLNERQYVADISQVRRRNPSRFRVRGGWPPFLSLSAPLVCPRALALGFGLIRPPTSLAKPVPRHGGVVPARLRRDAQAAHG